MEWASSVSSAPARSSLQLRDLRLLRFALHGRFDASRTDVEHYIRARFADRHGAHVEHFLPDIVSVGGAGGYCAAVGVAPAAAGRLFAESYLTQPVERVIAAA